MRKIFGLYGAGGFAREVMPIVRGCSALQNAEIFFIETNPSAPTVNGMRVLSEDEFFALPAEHKFFNVAIADSKMREVLAQRCVTKGALPLSLSASNSTQYDNNQLGDGAIHCAYSTVTSNATIGKFFHANLYSYVEHDCIIGDYVTFAPSVHCNGNVHIGDHAYIGTGAILRHGSPDKPLVIGKGAVVGMGAVVTKDVPDFATVIGNPARVMNG